MFTRKNKCSVVSVLNKIKFLNALAAMQVFNNLFKMNKISLI